MLKQIAITFMVKSYNTLLHKVHKSHKKLVNNKLKVEDLPRKVCRLSNLF